MRTLVCDLASAVSGRQHRPRRSRGWRPDLCLDFRLPEPTKATGREPGQSGIGQYHTSPSQHQDGPKNGA